MVVKINYFESGTKGTARTNVPQGVSIKDGVIGRSVEGVKEMNSQDVRYGIHVDDEVPNFQQGNGPSAKVCS